ncbi:MAG: MarC family protein [Planctomycetota bacterium]
MVEFCSVSLVLFSVIDIPGSLPLVVDIKNKTGSIQSLKATIAAGVLMLLFLFAGDSLLHLLGIDVSSFAVAGSIVIFLIGLEMILGVTIFKEDPDAGESASIVPLAFPMIAGAGTLTTILSLKAEFSYWSILGAILINLVIVYVALQSCGWLEKKAGRSGLSVLRKVFGIVLLSIAVKLFKSNLLA